MFILDGFFGWSWTYFKGLGDFIPGIAKAIVNFFVVWSRVGLTLYEPTWFPSQRYQFEVTPI